MTASIPRVSSNNVPLLELAAFPALVLFVFTIPWEDSLVLPGVGTISKFIGLLAFGLGLASIFRRTGIAVRRPGVYLVVFALFVVWTSASVIWAPVRASGIGYATTLVQLLLMCWLVWQLCRTRSARSILMQAYVLGSLVSVGNTVIQYFSGTTIADSSEMRFAATGFNANYLASTLALAIPMAWALYISKPPKWLAVVSFLSIPAVVLAVFLTGSRGGMITVALALLVMPLTYARLSARAQAGAVLGLATLGVVAYFAAPAFEQNLPDSIRRFAEIPQEIGSSDMTGRGDIWSAGITMFKENPALGVGAGAFYYEVKRYLGFSITAHNAWVNVAAQTGLIGLLLFCATIVVVGLPLVIDTRGDRLVYLVLLATALLTLLPSTLENGKQVWFAFALCASTGGFVMGRPASIGRRDHRHVASTPEQSR